MGFEFALTTLFVFFNAQTHKFQLLDDLNATPIKYANIKSEKSDFGTSSDSLGVFYFEPNQNIIINAVGYESKTLALSENSSVIKLSKRPFIIEEVSLLKRKNEIEITIDGLKGNHYNRFYCLSLDNNSAWIIGKYFENFSYKTPFLKSITVFTESEIANALFNIRVYSVDENNEPKEELYHQNIIGTAKKGKNKTTIDLSKTQITMPKNGIFIAVDWLKIPENIYEYSYTMGKDKTKRIGKNFAPCFGTVLLENSRKTLIFRNNKWSSALKGLREEDNKYWILAMELTLTN